MFSKPLAARTAAFGAAMALVAIPLVLALAIGCIGLAEAQSSAIEIVSPWARATSGSVGGAFMTIVNKGSSDDSLTGATSPVAATAALHQTRTENGVAEMIPIPVLVIPAGGKVTLAPGSYHLMLMDLKAPLKQGESFPLTLTFEKAGTIAVKVRIEQAGARSGGDMNGMNMN